MAFLKYKTGAIQGKPLKRKVAPEETRERIRNQNLELQKNIYILLFWSIGFDAPVADHNILFNVVMKPGSVLLPRIR
jgi:hypothetical protein